MPFNHKLLRPKAAVAAAGPAPWSPLDVPNLFGWWDFSDASTLGPTSSGAGAVSNNGPVKYVGDKSGNGRHMLQSGADSAAPTYLTNALNGKSVLGFDGGDGLLCNSAASLSGQTVFVVLRMQSGTSSYGRAFSQASANASNSDGNSGLIPVLRWGGGQVVGSYDGSGATTVSITNNQWVLISASRGGGTISVRKNNGTASTGNTANTTLSHNYFAIGSAISAGDYWQDRIAEVIMWSRVITDSERNLVASYVGEKWGITVA